MNEEIKNKEVDTAKGEVEESRRRFLKKAGKLAIYTPPAMAMMMQPSQASFLRSGGVTTLRDRLEQRSHEEWEQEFQSLLQRITNFFKSISGNGDD